MKDLKLIITVFLFLNIWLVTSTLAQGDDQGKIENNDIVDYVNPYIGNIGHLLKPTHPVVHLPNSFMAFTPDRGDQTDVMVRGLPLIKCESYYSAFHISPFQGNKEGIKPVISYNYDNEEVTPYSYSVVLNHLETEVNFGLSHQSAMYQIQFNGEGESFIILNAQNGMLKWDGESVSGHQIVNNGVKVYVYLESDKQPLNNYILENHKLIAKEKAEGKNACIVLNYQGEATEVILRYGISFISVEQAKRNMKREVDSKSMDDIHAEGRRIWNNTLDKIKITGGTDDEKTMFYTALYRNYRFPVIVSEDGRYYSPFDHQIHNDNGTPFYSGTHDSGWNASLGVRPLGVLLEPEREGIILNSILQIADQLETYRMPRYIGLTGHKVGMISNHTIVSFWDAYVKGIRGFDLEKAFDAGKTAVMERTLAPVSDEPAGELNRFYQEHGYIPALWEGQKETFLPQVKPFTKRMAVAVTLGTAHDDWALAQMAKTIGYQEDFQYFCNRSYNYRNLFNSGTGFFHPRDKNGRFIRPIDYVYSGGLHGRDFYDESNGWIYRFRMQYNIDDLIVMMGGREKFVSNLDELFAKQFPEERHIQLYRYHNQTGIVGHFSMGNEPSFHIPYLYNYASEPWKTQKRVRTLMKQWYRNDVFGISGDEDAGAMSAFAVFSAMGFYPLTTGMPVYTIGSPIFEHVKIEVSKDRYFEVIAENNTGYNKYIQSATLNGKPLNQPWLAHSDISNGGKLVLQMGPRPNKEWGSDASAVPPSTPLQESDCVLKRP